VPNNANQGLLATCTGEILAVLGLFCSIRDKISWTCRCWRYTEKKNLC